MKMLFLVVLVLSFSAVHAQHASDSLKPDDKKFDLGFEGMLGASVGNDFYSFNVGGPSFRFRITKDIRVGLGALPSFYVKNGQPGAKLGVSPRIDYKNIVLIAPFFHFEHDNEWVWSIGIGYKFH